MWNSNKFDNNNTIKDELTMWLPIYLKILYHYRWIEIFSIFLHYASECNKIFKRKKTVVEISKLRMRTLKHLYSCINTASQETKQSLASKTQRLLTNIALKQI